MNMCASCPPLLSSEQQWRDLSHCLSQLTFTERCVRKLHDNLACYQDKLVDATVYADLQAILSRAKKLAKPEARALAEELDQKIRELHRKGLEEEGEGGGGIEEEGVEEEEGRKEGASQTLNSEDDQT